TGAVPAPSVQMGRGPGAGASHRAPGPVHARTPAPRANRGPREPQGRAGARAPAGGHPSVAVPTGAGLGRTAATLWSPPGRTAGHAALRPANGYAQRDLDLPPADTQKRLPRTGACALLRAPGPGPHRPLPEL